MSTEQLSAETITLLRSALTQIEALANVRVVIIAIASHPDGGVEGHPHYISTLPREVGAELLANVVESVSHGETTDVTPEPLN